MKLAMDKGSREILEQVGIFADGVAVAQIGEYTWEIAKECVDEVITVSTRITSYNVCYTKLLRLQRQVDAGVALLVDLWITEEQPLRRHRSLQLLP